MKPRDLDSGSGAGEAAMEGAAGRALRHHLVSALRH